MHKWRAVIFAVLLSGCHQAYADISNGQSELLGSNEVASAAGLGGFVQQLNAAQAFVSYPPSLQQAALPMLWVSRLSGAVREISPKLEIRP